MSKSFKRKVYRIIFEADTFYGKLFDIILLISILLSVIGVMLESIKEINKEYHNIILALQTFP